MHAPTDEDREEQEAAGEHTDETEAALTAVDAGAPMQESRGRSPEPPALHAADACKSGKVAWQALTSSPTPSLSASSYRTPTSIRSIKTCPVYTNISTFSKLAGETNSREKTADAAAARVNRLWKYVPAQANTARWAAKVRFPTCRNTSQY